MNTPARKLHIGGKVRMPGWEVLNAVPGPAVDHVGNAKDLSVFPVSTFAEVYASHVLEHLDYVRELAPALKEWNRVLIPGGILSVSVPDLDVLAALFIRRDQFSPDERFMLMRMMFGGHVDEFDFHQVGLNREFLGHFLTAAGFTKLEIVRSFNLFNDTSNLLFKGVLISLNMRAQKPSANLWGAGGPPA